MPIEDDIHLEITGLHLDIIARFKLAPNGYCGLSLACSPDNREHISIMYEQDRQRLCVRKVNLETNDVLTTHIRDVPHRLATGDRLQLRIMVDGSVIEIIANDRTSLTSRHYPGHPDSNGVRIIGLHAQLESLDIWEMASIWDQ